MIKRTLKKLLVITIILALMGGSVTAWSWHSFFAPGPLAEEKTIILPKGSGFFTAVNTLTDEGVIANKAVFTAMAIVTGKFARIKAGEYAFPAGTPASDVLTMMAEGKVVIHRIIVYEGWNVRQVVESLTKEKVLTGDIPGDIPEGSLLPETYYFTYGDNRADLIRRMQEGMDEVLDRLWPMRPMGLPYASPQDALTLASIVEAETNLDAERPRVAAVYLNRIKRGMKLQADPTVIYGIEKETGKPLGRQLFLTDLSKPTPYNTYTQEGMPPGPIGNPGRKSIEAALNPADTEELFFVATGNGGHWFAKTGKEHEENVRRYRGVQASKK